MFINKEDVHCSYSLSSEFNGMAISPNVRTVKVNGHIYICFKGSHKVDD